MTIPQDHLRSCSEHRLVDDRDHPCPACTVGVSAHPDAVSDTGFTAVELKQQVSAETLTELVEVLENETAELDHVEAYVAVAEVDTGDSSSFIETAAGYTNQERWFNVAVIEYEFRDREIIARQPEAEDVLTALENDESYIYEEPCETPQTAPDADSLKAIVAPHVYKSNTGLINNETIVLYIGAPGETHYSQARRELGSVAGNVGYNVYTAKKRTDIYGNVEALIEVSLK